MSLSSTASRREESNLHHVVPNHACSRYTTSSCATPKGTRRRVLSHGITVQLSKSSSRAPVPGMRQHGGKDSNPHRLGWNQVSSPLDDHRSRARISCATRTDYQKSRIDFWVRPRGRIRYAHVNVDSCSLPSSCFLTLRITSDGEAESRSGQQLFPLHAASSVKWASAGGRCCKGCGERGRHGRSARPQVDALRPRPAV